MIVHILNASGDTTMTLDTHTEAEIKAVFDEMVEKGYMAFQVDEQDRSKGEQIKSYDPAAHEILIMAPLVGG